MKRNNTKYYIKAVVAITSSAVATLLLLHFTIPNPLFGDPYSFVLQDKNGDLLGARIATDGQWRFPELNDVPEKYEKAVLCFEDQRFFWHQGVDPIALARAAIHNIREKRIVSGGSTLTMQLARMAKGNPPRTVLNKLLEIWMAGAIELKYSKREILAKYASHAPFGGNVVGLEMAAYRYFGKAPSQLSWAEAATLAVLPNSPALIHPGRNRNALRVKRDALLDRLYNTQSIDSLTWVLSMLEPLPEEPRALPDIAPHFLEFARQHTNENRVVSTIDPQLQGYCNRLADHHLRLLEENAIHNVAILVLDTKSGRTLAYVGNGKDVGIPKRHVDMVQAERSSGSILKPFLYGAAWDRGLILPGTLLDDIPVSYNGYKPENYHRQYEGMVAADQALIRSLNVPSVALLKEFGIGSFKHILQEANLSTIHFSPDHYGLTLILGGAEVKLWELTSAYAGLCRLVLNWEESPYNYQTGTFSSPVWEHDADITTKSKYHPDIMSAGAAWILLNTLREVRRPNEEGSWEQFTSSRHIAWKTGTSYGFRDAWAVGVNPDVTIGIWVGNADGEGRPGIIGSKAAAPLLFEILSWFGSAPELPIPYDDLEYGSVCTASGHLSGPFCEAEDTILITRAGHNTDPCPYHRQIHIENASGLRADMSCTGIENLEIKSWFVLPPGQAWYYAKVHPSYLRIPGWKTDCRGTETGPPVAIVYPADKAKLDLPVELDGEKEPAVMQAVHRNPSEILHWHLDGKYLTSTRDFHTVALGAAPGIHRLVVVDSRGNRDERTFEILDPDMVTKSRYRY